MSHDKHEHDIEKGIREILRSVRETLDGVRELLRRSRHKQLTYAVAVRFKGASMQPNNTLVFNVGQSSQASLMPLLADGITNSGGTVSNVTYTFNDPSASVVLNADGLTATCTGLAPSNGPVTGTATCTVTDTDGAVSQWTQTFTITTNLGGPPGQLTQSVAVQFTDPTGTLSPGTQSASLKAGKRPLNE